jgi:hypothetical protein
MNGNVNVKIRNFTFNGLPGGYPAIKVLGGTLIIENCIFENIPGNALDIEPNGAFNLVMKHSRISSNTAAGVLIKPAAGGSVTVTQTLSESLCSAFHVDTAILFSGLFKPD